jgi:iron(III) transport system substrate-binding protein
MVQKIVIIGALVLILAVPFALREKRPTPGRADDVLVVITPHNEAIRAEFGAGFQRWYAERTGRSVFLDWRVIGGTSEIVRFLRSEYLTAFEVQWRRQGRPWNAEIQAAIMDDRITLPADPAEDTEAQAARRAFLASEVSCGIDVFFGGGSFDFDREARAGRLVDSGFLQRHPEWFTDEVIPQRFAGEVYWDRQGRWIGAVVSNYGILYNRDSFARLGVDSPLHWRDLTNPRLIGEVALADPTKSGSMGKAFEMVMQQEIYRRLRALEPVVADPAEREARAVREGWIEGLRVIQLAGANARYFTDSSQKPPIDIAQGNSAVGMCIDFYGRFQEEAVTRRDGSARLRYVSPPGGSVYSVDPIGLLRGAPNREVALAFFEFVLSMEGQKLWNFRVGTPGGPERFALRRLPVRRDFYAQPEFVQHRSDPTVEPYNEPDQLVYRAEWTGPLFREMTFIIRMIALDTHLELQAAWRAIAQAGMPEEAMARLTDLSTVDYDRARTEIRQRLAARDRVDELRLANELARTFRENYREARRLAREHARTVAAAAP